jgi:FkbM family methyltransferase
MSPIKRIRIGLQRFDIAGISTADGYFASLSDDFEPEFNRICNDFVRDDYVCLDIGANIGVKSLLLSQHTPDGCVIAIEPAPTVAALLEQNIVRSGRTNIKIVKTAIGDSDGVVNFSDFSAYGHISAPGVQVPGASLVEVPVCKLASLVAEFRLERLDFVKIDVEGYEFPILRSSIDLLNHYHSVVFFEFNAWCQIALSEVSPKEFAGWIFNHFSNVFMIRRGTGEDYLERLPADGALRFLHTNLVRDGTITDLLVTNFERRLAATPNQIRSQAMRAERDAALAESQAMRAERDALGGQLAKAQSYASNVEDRLHEQHAHGERLQASLDRYRARSLHGVLRRLRGRL